MPRDYDKGTRILSASLQGSELAKLDSVYDYLWRETIKRVYQHKTDAHMTHHDKTDQPAHAERKARTTLHDIEQWE